MVKTVVKPILGRSKRFQEIENPTPQKFFFCRYYTIHRKNSQVASLNTQNLRCSRQRKSSADLLAYHAEKSQKNQRDCKVWLSRHFVILCKCTISQSETNVNTQNLHCWKKVIFRIILEKAIAKFINKVYNILTTKQTGACIQAERKVWPSTENLIWIMPT